MTDAEIVANALAEDVGTGDITSETFVDAQLQAIGRIVAREKIVVAGTSIAIEVFRQVNPSVAAATRCADGSPVLPGTTIMEVRGSARSILTAERVALNFLQQLSGIATLTRAFVDAAGSSHAKILDTRKTTPGLRRLEKAAVVAGGGANHRFGLSDMALIKDNHIAAGMSRADLAQRIADLKKQRDGIRVEVEADNLAQVREFLEVPGVDVILLDNMKPAQLREAVALRKERPVKFEASGGINLLNVRQVAATGVDFISVGALTHSAPAVDLSLELTRLGA